MSQSIPILARTFKAGADFTVANRGCAVYLSAAETVAIATSAAVTPIGILDSYDKTGKPVRVVLLGTCKVRAETSFSAGDILGVADSDGKLDTAAVHVPAIAIALEAASAEDNLVEALVCHFSTHA
jgi:hypothetical protein